MASSIRRGFARQHAVLLLCLFTAFLRPVACETDTSTLGRFCSSDSQCSAPFVVCSEENRCEHKQLFPMTSVEIGSLFVMLVFLMVSIIVSIAGGAVIVPLSSYLMGFSARQAVALSNSIVLMTAIVKYIMALFKRNPFVPYKTIIDYNAAMLMIPPMALFSSIGGILVTFVPDIFILLMLATVNGWACFSGYFNLRTQLEKERIKKLKAAENPDSITKEAGPQKETELKELLIQPISKTNTEEQPATIQPAQSSIELKETNGGIPSAQKDSPGPAADVVVESKPSEFAAEIEAQKQIESSNFVWKKYWVFVAVLVLTILVALLRGGKGGDSIVGVSRCSSTDWFLLLLYVGALGTFPFYTSKVILKEQEHKKAIGWEKDHTEIHLDQHQLTYGTAWAGTTGLLSSMMGIGGGVMLTPLMLKFQYQPVTSAWTINMNTVMGKVAAVIMHAKTGDLLYDYVFLYGGVIVLGIIISENTVLEIVKKTKSQLFYPITFMIVISISFLLSLYVGIGKFAQNNKNGADPWAISGYCT